MDLESMRKIKHKKQTHIHTLSTRQESSKTYCVVFPWVSHPWPSSGMLWWHTWPPPSTSVGLPSSAAELPLWRPLKMITALRYHGSFRVAKIGLETDDGLIHYEHKLVCLAHLFSHADSQTHRGSLQYLLLLVMLMHFIKTSDFKVTI